jgi:hypothetical protein
MNHEIEINNNTFIIPNISGYSRVAKHGLNSKPGFFIFHSGRATLLEFDSEELANKKREELISSIGNFWNINGNNNGNNNNGNNNSNNNNKFNSTNKENKNNYNKNKGFFNKK